MDGTQRWHLEAFKLLKGAYGLSNGRITKDKDKFAGIPEKLNKFVHKKLPGVGYRLCYFDKASVVLMMKKIKTFLRKVTTSVAQDSTSSTKFDQQNERHYQVCPLQTCNVWDSFVLRNKCAPCWFHHAQYMCSWSVCCRL